VSVLALSQTTTALVAALGGALVGGGAAFAGTWWERRTERRQARYEDVRAVLRSINSSAQDVLLQYVLLGDENDKRALIEAEARLGTATADLMLYRVDDDLLGESVDCLFRLGSKLATSSSHDAGLEREFKTAYTDYIVAARSHLDRFEG
jgi:hypothetical protein